MLVDCLEDMLKPMTAMYYEQDETKKVRVYLFSDLSFFKCIRSFVNSPGHGI